MADKIMNYIILYLPVIMAGFCAIISSFKIIANCKEWKDSLNESNIKELRDDLRKVVKDNIELRTKISEVLTENDEIKHKLKLNLEETNAILLEIKELATKEIEKEKIEESKEE